MRSFYAMHRSAMPVVVGTLTTVVFIGLYFLLKGAFPVGHGYLALPLSGSIAAVLMSISLIALAYRDTGGFDVGGVFTTFLKAALAASVAGAIAFGSFHFAPHSLGKLTTLLLFFAVFCISAWVYYFITKLLGMKESETISRATEKARRKLGFSSPVE